MLVEIVDNVSRTLASVLLSTLQWTADVRIAVAFVSARGIAVVEQGVLDRLHAGARFEFLVGLAPAATEPQAIWRLYQLCRDNPNAELYCYADLGPAITYHPKLYIMGSQDEVVAILGSSNLTEGGLRRNVEVNALIRAGFREEIVSDVYSAYNRLKFHPARVEPDGELLDLYQRICERHRQEERAVNADPVSRRTLSEFREKARTLKRPTPTARDLVGWTRLVYDRLPMGEFANAAIYAFERELQSYYPGNQNVRPKIRQQLQLLRNMGLVAHLGRARWRKR